MQGAEKKNALRLVDITESTSRAPIIGEEIILHTTTDQVSWPDVAKSPGNYAFYRTASF